MGLTVEPILGKRLRMQIAADYRDAMTYSTELDQMRRIHVGLELNYADTIFLRGGMNQRYWKGGMEISLNYVQLQLASYGEEVGTKELTREDRRYMGKFALRF
jgi:hypothetical protein